jgi:hypothetical protein
MKVVPETHIGTILLMVICFRHLYASEKFGNNPVTVKATNYSGNTSNTIRLIAHLFLLLNTTFLQDLFASLNTS